MSLSIYQDTYLKSVGLRRSPREYPDQSSSSKEAYAEKDTLPAEVTRLKSAFKNMHLRANAKVTSDRVFSMVVHPMPTKTVALVGDKYGMLGM